MDAADVRLRLLLTRPAKRRGAMFRRSLGSEVLVFSFTRPMRRLFHTFFCPPLRIMALDDDGLPMFNEIRTANCFILLPQTRVILECDPMIEFSERDLRSIALFATNPDWKE